MPRGRSRSRGSARSTLFEPVIGLEVHCQLRTKSKAFCACPVVFGAPPNTAVCPVCLGYPGVLPVREPRDGDARDARRARDRLHDRGALGLRAEELLLPGPAEGLPDLAVRPAARDAGRGRPRRASGSPKSVRLNRIHLEEDAGKSMHDFPWDDVPTGVSLVDLNRAGTPLIEIVSEPDLSSAEEAYEYLVHLRRLVRWVDASDGNMEEGSLRCDANVSVRKKGAAALGTKVEIKNLNSFAHVKKAIEHEVERQVRALEAGQTLVQETRLYEPATGATKTMRSEGRVDGLSLLPRPRPRRPRRRRRRGRRTSPRRCRSFPEARAARLASAFGLPAADADLVCLSRPLADLYEAAVAAYPKNPKALANWLLSELLARMSDADRHAGRMPVAPGTLAALVAAHRRRDDLGKDREGAAPRSHRDRPRRSTIS